MRTMTIVEDPSDSDFGPQEIEYRRTILADIMSQLRLKHGDELTDDHELRLIFGVALSTTDELDTIVRLLGLIPPRRTF